MIAEIRVGPAVLSDGVIREARAGKTGAVVTADAHGRYQEGAIRGQLFSASNVAAQAVSVALATTYTGLVLSNPLGNTKLAVILGCQYALSVAPAGIASLHLIAGYSATASVTHTTPLASPGIQNNLIGTGPASSMKADSAATIVNPNYLIPLGSGFTAAALYATTPLWIDLGGLFILPPGAWIAIGALTAVTGFGGFAWEEVAI
jgi:hypothetical protein